MCARSDTLGIVQNLHLFVAIQFLKDNLKTNCAEKSVSRSRPHAEVYKRFTNRNNTSKYKNEQQQQKLFHNEEIFRSKV